MPNQNPPANKGQKIEQTVEGLQYLHQLYQSQYVLLTQEINSMLDGLSKLNNAQRTINNIESVRNKNTLLPIGGDIFLNAAIGDARTVIVSIGGGYLIEEDVENAKQFVSKQVQNQTTQINALMKNKRELENAVLDVSYRLEQLAR
jgi:prefoldin alpha subunit